MRGGYRWGDYVWSGDASAGVSCSERVCGLGSGPRVGVGAFSGMEHINIHADISKCLNRTMSTGEAFWTYCGPVVHANGRGLRAHALPVQCSIAQTTDNNASWHPPNKRCGDFANDRDVHVQYQPSRALHMSLEHRRWRRTSRSSIWVG